jgi:hypothetical protein
MDVRALCIATLLGCGGSVSSGSTTDASTSDATSSDTTVTTDTATVDVGVPRACESPGMCALVPASCCGRCGVATSTDQIALPRESVAKYREQACMSDGGSIGCPECAGERDPELQAFCRGGSCVPVFVPTDSVAECASDADCIAVHGICCGSCDSERTLVAINKSKVSEFNSQICDPRVDCTSCPTPTMVKSTVRCDAATKHCAITRVL